MGKGKVIKPAIIVFIIVLIFTVIGLLMLKYDVEGELNMPFNLSKIIIVSSAEGIESENSENTWDLNLIQNNDIYIEINKNENYKKTEIIDKITLSNFNIAKKPNKGNVTIYKPVQNETKVYDYSEESKVTDNIEYKASQNTDIKKLEIANQGGRILFRASIDNLGTYISNDEQEITHDGRILKNVIEKSEDLKSTLSFDISIKLISGVEYKANAVLDIPQGDVITEGTTSIEITDLSNIIFKRI